MTDNMLCDECGCEFHEDDFDRCGCDFESCVECFDAHAQACFYDEEASQ